MSKYLVFDSTGLEARRGECPDAYVSTQAQQGETLRIVSVFPTQQQQLVNNMMQNAALPLPTMAELETTLLALVKSKSASTKMRYMSTGTGKALTYARQGEEVVDYDALGTTLQGILTALLGMTDAAIKTKFPHAWWSMKRRGETTITPAIERFRAGIAVSQQHVARIESIEQNALRLIKAASTSAAKQAAFDAIDWNWSVT